MNQMVMMAIGIEMFGKMVEANTIDRVAAATTTEEKATIVQETEKFAFEVIGGIFKPDSEIGEDGVKAKELATKGLIEHQYNYFKLPNPFENGTTMEDVKARNQIGE